MKNVCFLKVEMTAALAQIQHFGCSFIVGGRAASTDGKFLTLEDVLEGSELPDSLRGQRTYYELLNPFRTKSGFSY